MDLQLHRDPRAFTALADPFYGTDTIRHTVALTVMARFLGMAREQPPIMGTLHHDGELIGVALRTPPWPVIVPGCRPTLFSGQLPDPVAGGDPELPGVSGPVENVTAVADVWTRRTGGTTKVALASRLFRLGELIPPVTTGQAREATEDDLDLLVKWRDDFEIEALGFQRAHDEGPASIRRMFENRDSVILWEDGGKAVAWAVASAPIGGMSRVGPVYTPPEHRAHGYGSAVTAAVSQHARDAAAQRRHPLHGSVQPDLQLHLPEDRLPPGVRLDGARIRPATLDYVTPPRLLVLQLDEQDPIGPLGDWLTDAGAELDIRKPGDFPADTGGHQGLVCLGGHMGAYDDLDHPWLADVRRLLAEATTKGLPALAICLGAQLLAVATGGRVTTGPDGPEVGPLLVAKRDVGWNDPLFADLPFMPDVMQFHSDVIEQLPPNASLLAASRRSTRTRRSASAAPSTASSSTSRPPRSSSRAGRRTARTPPSSRGPATWRTTGSSQAHADLEETWRPFAARFVKLAVG